MVPPSCVDFSQRIPNFKPLTHSFFSLLHFCWFSVLSLLPFLYSSLVLKFVRPREREEEWAFTCGQDRGGLHRDVQRRIILRMEDHPITVQVTLASFVFISTASYLVVVKIHSWTAKVTLSFSSHLLTLFLSLHLKSFSLFLFSSFFHFLSFLLSPSPCGEIIRTSVKQRLNRS